MSIKELDEVFSVLNPIVAEQFVAEETRVRERILIPNPKEVMNLKDGKGRIIRRRILSLRRAYRDFILFSLLVGLIITFVWTLYSYLLYHETLYLMIAFVFGLLSMLVGIARFVFVVEFWRAIVESWRKRRRKEN